jgi:putative Mn2+ efflux pump MntP
MSLLEIIFIAVGLSMDTFAVSITLGLSTKKLSPFSIITPGIYFGFFQSVMPLIGYFSGIYFANRIQDADHWVAFFLLALIGGKMIKDSFSKEKREGSFGFKKMITLAVATSIDALAIGITFAFLKVNIYTAILIIGVITFIISMGGVIVGNTFGIKLKSKAGLIGGTVLILIGIKIVIEHLFF